MGEGMINKYLCLLCAGHSANILNQKWLLRKNEHLKPLRKLDCRMVLFFSPMLYRICKVTSHTLECVDAQVQIKCARLALGSSYVPFLFLHK